ncbi:hypothetical protein PR048_006157 [Dryococelus australis]|uniref:Major facilitator superfamily (MFS) profile domain-containing protein n=1 Tax=Dryococelus australis TaxID=614101 RepID=A0ABQ9ICD6_9NEOP|nr:hypothetical protein PR048_006157 [Dryococelus australis]
MICTPVGSLLSGLALERLGRKRSMMVVNVPLLVSWVLFYFVNSPSSLLATSALMGLSLGIVEAPILTYVAEVSQPKLRGMLTTFTELSVNVGMFCLYLIGTLTDWRTTAAISASLPIISIIAISQVLFAWARAADPRVPGVADVAWQAVGRRAVAVLAAWLGGASRRPRRDVRAAALPPACARPCQRRLRRQQGRRQPLPEKVSAPRHRLFTVQGHSLVSRPHVLHQAQTLGGMTHDDDIRRAGRGRWSLGFLEDLPVSPSFHSGTAPYSPQSPSSACCLSPAQVVVSEGAQSYDDLAANLRAMLRPETLRPLAMVIVMSVLEHWCGVAGTRPYMVEVFNEFGLPIDAHWATPPSSSERRTSVRPSDRPSGRPPYKVGTRSGSIMRKDVSVTTVPTANDTVETLQETIDTWKLEYSGEKQAQASDRGNAGD